MTSREIQELRRERIAAAERRSQRKKGYVARQRRRGRRSTRPKPVE